MDAMRIRCGIWCRRLLLACCGPAVQDRSCAVLRDCYGNAMGIRDHSVLPAWCLCRRTTRANSIHESCAGSSVYWPAMAPDAIRTRHVLACCCTLPLFQCSRPGRLLRIFKAATGSVRSGRNPEQADAIKADAGVHCLDWCL